MNHRSIDEAALRCFSGDYFRLFRINISRLKHSNFTTILRPKLLSTLYRITDKEETVNKTICIH